MGDQDTQMENWSKKFIELLNVQINVDVCIMRYQMVIGGLHLSQS